MGRLYQRQDAIESEKYAEIRITPLRGATLRADLLYYTVHNFFSF